MSRSVTSAESCVENFLRGADHDALNALSDHLSQITNDSGNLLESIVAARVPLSALLPTLPRGI